MSGKPSKIGTAAIVAMVALSTFFIYTIVKYRYTLL